MDLGPDETTDPGPDYEMTSSLSTIPDRSGSKTFTKSGARGGVRTPDQLGVNEPLYR